MENWKDRLRAVVTDQGWDGAWKQLSRESGLGETFVRDILDPDYDKDPSVANLQKLCRRLGISAAEILDGTPTPYQRVAVTGRIVNEEWKPSNEVRDAEFRVRGEPVALEIQDDSINGYRRGDVVIGVKQPIAEADKFIGRECIIETADNKRYVRYLQKSSVRGRFTLRSHDMGKKDVQNVKLTLVAPIVWVRRLPRTVT
jgi:hypothetical protein